MLARLIINIRGPNGSGKSTLARGFLAYKAKDEAPLSYKPKGVTSPRLWPVARCAVPGLRLPVYVLGRYAEGVGTGGCDTEKDMDAVEQLVRECVSKFTDGHILFEGFVVAKSGGRWIKVAQDVNRASVFTRYVWVFTRPPLDDLVRRIQGRNGGSEPKKDLLAGTMRTVDLIRIKVKQAFEKRHIIDLDPEYDAQDSFEDLVCRLELLESHA